MQMRIHVPGKFTQKTKPIPSSYTLMHIFQRSNNTCTIVCLFQRYSLVNVQLYIPENYSIRLYVDNNELQTMIQLYDLLKSKKKYNKHLSQKTIFQTILLIQHAYSWYTHIHNSAKTCFNKVYTMLEKISKPMNKI